MQGRREIHVVIPVKGFADAKARLAGSLDDLERRHLAETMATRVLAAAGTLPVTVVTDNGSVAAWAMERGADVVDSSGEALNGSIRRGLTHAEHRGASTALIAHADLPLAIDFEAVLAEIGPGRVVMVADRRGDGTNVMAVGLPSALRLAYGPGSFAAHRADAHRRGLEVVVVDDERLSWDVDIPEDLRPPAALGSIR